MQLMNVFYMNRDESARRRVSSDSPICLDRGRNMIPLAYIQDTIG